MTHQHRLQKNNRFWLLLLLIFAFAESNAQSTQTDTAYRQLPLYKKGQTQIVAGGVLLTLGTLGALALASQPAKEPTGFNFGPSDKDMAAFMVGLFVGGTGLILLAKGLLNVNAAKTQIRLGYVSYLKQPKLQGYMPSLTFSWQPGKASSNRLR